MVLRFVHTADWQLGMKAQRVAAVAEQVREARFETVRRIVKVAQERDAGFILVAGDVFEHNAVSNELVYRLVRLLEQARLPIYLLPGNHDPLGPGSVYARPVMERRPPNVHILAKREPVPVLEGEAFLLPAPVSQKRSESDPTLGLPATPEGAFRIGVAHGAPRIEGKYQPDDHPIALDAAAREGLDYLALGHWHSWVQIDPRTTMPGTPEPTEFDEESGYVAVVTLEPLRPPMVEKVPVASLTWVEESLELPDRPEELAAQLERLVKQVPAPERTLLRLRLSGFSTGALDAELDEWCSQLSTRFLHAEVDTSQVRPALADDELRRLAESHPFVGGLLKDLERLSVLVGAPGAAVAETAAAGDVLVDLPGADMERLRALSREIEDPAVVREAMRRLVRLVREVWP